MLLDAALEAPSFNIPESFVQLDIVDPSEGEFSLHLNRFMELEGLYNPLFLPIDIRIDPGYTGTLTFRLENVEGFTNENLVVKTTTPDGSGGNCQVGLMPVSALLLLLPLVGLERR